MPLFSTIFALAIAAGSLYALYYSAQSIPKLRRYEAEAEKAAEWSNVAEKRLWDTRYTVGAGFAVTLLSLVSSCYYTVFTTSTYGILWAALLAAAEYSVVRYMNSFWSDKRNVPLMDDYNDAISHTTAVTGLSEVLAFGWAGMFALKTFGY
ncbi:hypothetical protein B0H67DRAFT_586555 [Lasiosphaeris hirsuta]|uniref:Uncharacterized protein n=1 Tax=Lasiosphaeris hirsuta TaxID=260670 RepID=A0AA40AA60_9PEZI|nr:hypothetical protein B0H67DRAFT_586555 [Lasiosphaeris hirsuta]